MREQIEIGSANGLGWRDLFTRVPDSYLGEYPREQIKPLLNLVHLSDTHICDAQSPARVEFLDRFADPHHPITGKAGFLVGTYRAHEIFTMQVLNSMIRKVNQIDFGPVTKTSFDAVVMTGDLVDNAQNNELDWFLGLISGGKCQPDSGSKNRWEGVGGDFYSQHYWNPHGTPSGEKDDYPRSLYGFPIIPELLDAVRESFNSEGLRLPWLAVHGNHDALLQGTVRPNSYLEAIATGSRKFKNMSDEEALITLKKFSEVGPAQYPTSTVLPFEQVEPDSKRAFLKGDDWSTRFHTPRYWRRDYGGVSLIALDTVNPHGGWQGSLGLIQFHWLRDQLNMIQNSVIVLTSHHPLQDLFNTYAPEGAEPRVGREEIETLLSDHTGVALWLCGHTHRHKVTFFGTDSNLGFWQVETASLIDWPQQGRLVEIYESGDKLGIALTPLDHGGKLITDPTTTGFSPDDLAGLSRLLSANDWQRRQGKFRIEHNHGEREDQRVILQLPLSRFKKHA